MIFLDLDSLLHVANKTLGSDPVVRDYGLLEAALARPQSLGHHCFATNRTLPMVVADIDHRTTPRSSS